MAERSTISQSAQLGVETTPGTGVAATKRLGSIGFGFGPQVTSTTQRPVGQKYPNLRIVGKEWTEADISGNPVYTELPYLFASLMSTPTITAILDGATPTLGYKWTFNSASFGDDVPKTYTVEQGSSFRAHRVVNGLITDFTLDWNREELSIDGTLLAKALEDGVTLTASPTSLTQVPVRPAELSVYLDNSSATIGTTKMTRTLSGSFNIGSRFSPLWVVDAAQSSFVSTIESEPDIGFSLKQMADANGMARLTEMRGNTTKFCRLEAVGPTIYTGGVTVRHQLRIDMAGQVNEPDNFDDEDGVFAIEWGFGGVHDSTWGKAYTVEVITTTATL